MYSITWKNIAFYKVPFPIFVTQNYWDQNLGPKPNSTSNNNTRIQDMRFENFAGVILEFVNSISFSVCHVLTCRYYP